MSRLQSSIDHLTRLVGFPSVTDTPNDDMMAYVAETIIAHGGRVDVVPQKSGIGVNLFATFGPEGDGGVVLSGHLDVVPVEGQPWTHDPFTLTHIDNKLYGRGSCDMKGYTACILAALPAIQAANLKRPLHIALTADEELHMEGVSALIARLGREAPKPTICLVGEPTEMKVVTGHKGIAILRIHVRGHEVHSSRNHEGVSAIMVAAKIINWVDAKNTENRRRAEANPGSNPFNPPWTTLHCGEIQGGTAHNITARDCRLMVDIRPIAGETIEQYCNELKAYVASEIEPAMKAVNAETGVTIHTTAGVPPLAPEKNGAAEALARRITGDNGVHVVAYAAEAGPLQQAGLSTIICGPGNIEQAHKPDEFIAISELEKCNTYLDRLIKALEE